MSDELERQLESFGATLAHETGEPMTPDRRRRAEARAGRRYLSVVGAAAGLVLVVAGLLWVADRGADSPTAQPPATDAPASATSPATTTTTTTSTTTVAVPVSERVPPDPLGLERDGWTLVQRTIEPLEYPTDEIPCEAAAGLAEFDGITEVHDILTPPDGNGLDLDISVVEVGSLERGNELAAAVSAIGDCVAETQGVDVSTAGLSSIRASWFRAGPDFALVTIVGEGDLTIVLEIEGEPFGDELIAELAHRADDYLRTGEPAVIPTVPAGSTTTSIVVRTSGDVVVSRAGPVGTVDREPAPGELLLWVSNQSSTDNAVQVVVESSGVVVVDEEFAWRSGHEWLGYFVDGLTPGVHRLAATSSTGVADEFEVTIDADRPTWAVLDYWRASDDTSGRRFTFRESDELIGFA